MNIISSKVDMNEYKLLGTKSKQKKLRVSLFLGFLKKLKKENKLKSDDRKWIDKIYKIQHIKNKIYDDSKLQA